MQQHHGRRGLRKPLGNQDRRRHAEPRRGVEANLFADIVAAIFARYDLCLRINFLGRIVQQFEHFCPRRGFPRHQVTMLVVQERQRHFALRFEFLNEDIERPRVRPVLGGGGLIE